MKLSRGKSAIAVVLVALLAGGGYYGYRQSVAQSLEQRYKLQTIANGDITQTVSALSLIHI